VQKYCCGTIDIAVFLFGDFILPHPVVAVILHIAVSGINMFSMDSLACSVEYLSLVDFSEVPEFYSALNDVVCHFTWRLDMSPNSVDYVAIFPVGWQSIDQYVCRQHVVISADSESKRLRTHSVTFPGMSLI